MKYIIFILITFSFSNVYSQNKLRPDVSEALKKTQDLMNNSSERQKYIDSHSSALTNDKNIDKLVNTNEQKEEIYNITSDIFGDIVNKDGGDINKMQQLINSASSDPESFYRGLSSEQKNKIKKLADELKPRNNNKD